MFILLHSYVRVHTILIHVISHVYIVESIKCLNLCDIKECKKYMKDQQRKNN